MSVKTLGELVTMAMVFALLAACGDSGKQAPIQASDYSSANAVVGSLTVTPGTVGGCTPKQHMVSVVSWHAKVPSVKVLVAGSGQGEQLLFSEGGYSGSAKTGDWVANGTKFVLIDASDGNVLAEHTVTARPCRVKSD